MKRNPSDPQADLIAAIDTYGADIGCWPDAALAKRVREAVLSDRDVRAYLDESRSLARSLVAARDALDEEIRASGALGRVSAAVIARRNRAGPRQARWMAAAAAAIVIAAGIGGVVDARLMAGPNLQTVDVVVLDPLVFGPLETETE